jgi:hypothetical protein
MNVVAASRLDMAGFVNSGVTDWAGAFRDAVAGDHEDQAA